MFAPHPADIPFELLSVYIRHAELVAVAPNVVEGARRAGLSVDDALGALVVALDDAIVEEDAADVVTVRDYEYFRKTLAAATVGSAVTPVPA